MGMQCRKPGEQEKVKCFKKTLLHWTQDPAWAVPGSGVLILEPMLRKPPAHRVIPGVPTWIGWCVQLRQDTVIGGFFSGEDERMLVMNSQLTETVSRPRSYCGLLAVPTVREHGKKQKTRHPWIGKFIKGD